MAKKQDGVTAYHGNVSNINRRILIACHELVLSGGILRFERVGAVLRRWGHEVAFMPLAKDWEPKIYISSPIYSFEQASKMQWDAVMVPGSGFPEDTIQRFSRLRTERFGSRVQHVLNDQSRRDSFMKVNKIFQPHIVIFNNNHWPAGSFIDFQADRFHVLQGGVDINAFRPANCHQPRSSAKWVVGGQALKNPQPLIEALAHLPSHVMLKLYGEDRHQLAKRYKTLVDSGRLVLTGALHGEEILSSFYHSVDCVVMTETVAGWSNLAAEAMASAVPLICTKHGTGCFAVHEKTALLVDAPSPDRLAESIKRLMRDSALCVRLAGNARAVIEAFSWEDYARQLLELIRHNGGAHYIYAPEIGLYGKWPVSVRMQGLSPLLERAKGSSVIDLGAAEGVLALEFLHRRASKVHGFDIDSFRISKARELCSAWECAEFHTADLSDWQLFVDTYGGIVDDTYDIVLYLGVHHHLPPGQRLKTLSGAAGLVGRYLAVRTTSTLYKEDGIEKLLEAYGFQPMPIGKESVLSSSHLGILRIYERKPGK